MIAINPLTRRIAAALGLTLAAAGSALAQTIPPTVGNTFPAGFQVPVDASSGDALIGFGGAGPIKRTPVVFIHGNDATPYPTGCGKVAANMQPMAQYFANNGYKLGELWALGYQGNQCDLIDSPANSAGAAHTHAANIGELADFVRAVLKFTGAQKIDVVAHGMGVTLAREASRVFGGKSYVRRFVAIDGPNGGTLMCSPDPANYWALGFLGGYTPTSPLCQEIGSPMTPFLQTLNSPPPSIDPKNTLVIRNGDVSYPYMPWADGPVNGVPAVDSYGNPTDFSKSAKIPKAAYSLVLYGQGQYDYSEGTAHIGIVSSPDTLWNTFKFLSH